MKIGQVVSCTAASFELTCKVQVARPVAITLTLSAHQNLTPTLDLAATNECKPMLLLRRNNLREAVLVFGKKANGEASSVARLVYAVAPSSSGQD